MKTDYILPAVDSKELLTNW